MKNILLALLWTLLGCVQSANPTTSKVWYLNIVDTDGVEIDGVALLAELDGYWAEFGVSFEFGNTYPSVTIDAKHPTNGVLGRCGTGESCHVYHVARLDTEKHLANLITHEMGHSYGLKHPQEDSRFSAPYDGCDIMNAEYFGALCQSHYWNEIHRMDLHALLDGIE